MKKRTRAFSLRVIKLAASLPRNRISDTFVRQMVRSATGTAANYRAACLARSKAEFISKLGIAQEEADEAVFWIELAAEANLVKQKLVESLIIEGKEILAIIIASRKTAKRRPAKAKHNQKKVGR